MNTVIDLISDVNSLVETFLSENMEEVQAESLGLDKRSAYDLYVNDECIAVSIYQDQRLQYYGGFEYVDREQRYQVGDFVFYQAEESDDNGRVRKCIANWKRSES